MTTASEVPFAIAGETWKKMTKIGTVIRPPPMPNIPASAPTTTPITTSHAAVGPFKIISPEESILKNIRTPAMTRIPMNAIVSVRFDKRASNSAPISDPATDPIDNHNTTGQSIWS